MQEITAAAPLTVHAGYYCEEEEREKLERKFRHDVNGHLRCIVELSKLAGRREKDTPNADILRLIQESGEELGRLVNGMMAHGKLCAQQPVYSDVNADMLLDDIIAEKQKLFPQRKARVTREPVGTLRGDIKMLARLFSAVLDNAFRYHPQDAATAEIAVHAFSMSEHTDIIISDNGTGMEPRHFTRAFGLTERMHTHHEYSGAGIGLADAAVIAKAHDAEIGFIPPLQGYGTSLKIVWKR